MIDTETLTGIIEVIVAGAVLLAIWKFMDKVDEEIDPEKAKR